MTNLELYRAQDNRIAAAHGETRYEQSSFDQGSEDSSNWRTEIATPEYAAWLRRLLSDEYLLASDVDTSVGQKVKTPRLPPIRVDYRRAGDPVSTEVLGRIWLAADKQSLAQPSTLTNPHAAAFNSLARQWQRETEHLSDPEAVVLHPAYQRIIGMGRDVLPLIFQALLQRPALWYWALQMITGDDPVPPDAHTMRHVREAWLRYGTEHGYLR